MTDTEKHEIDLDAFFKDAAEPLPELRNTLMANILADAGEVTEAQQVLTERQPVKRKGMLARLMEPLGGIKGIAAVCACTVMGVTVGYAGTDTLQSIPGVGDIVASISGDPLDDFTYGNTANFSDFLAEG